MKFIERIRRTITRYKRARVLEAERAEIARHPKWALCEYVQSGGGNDWWCRGSWAKVTDPSLKRTACPICGVICAISPKRRLVQAHYGKTEVPRPAERYAKGREPFETVKG